MRVDDSFTFPGALLLLLALAGGAGGAQAAADRSLSGRWLADTARRVTLEVAAGEVVVVPSTDGRVHATVALEAQAVDFKVLRWASRAAQRLVGEAVLVAEPRGEHLALRVVYPGPHADRVIERWELEVPPALGLTARVNAGRLSVRDITGGLDLEVNVGSVRADIVVGSVRAHANVGSVTLDSQAERFGTVLLETNVGDVRADLRGRSLPREPVAPPASRLRLQGDGSDFYLLSTNVGDVSFNLRVP